MKPMGSADAWADLPSVSYSRCPRCPLWLEMPPSAFIRVHRRFHSFMRREVINPAPKLPAGSVRLGIDIGGTFTDVVAVGEDGGVWRVKVPATPHEFGR